MNTVKQLKSGKYAVVENGKNVLVTNNYGDIPDKRRAILAAAAPKLLWACQCAIADLEGIMPEFEPGGDRNHPAWKTISELRAAIQKAETI